jgi:predicted protein tyrosine phosphatase
LLRSIIVENPNIKHLKSNIENMYKSKLLFVCSKNKWRSLTAEKMLESNEDYSVKSAGTEAGARVKITSGLVRWADIIFVMEKKHRTRLQESFSSELIDKQIVVLNIPDDFQFMDEELISILESRLEAYLAL